LAERSVLIANPLDTHTHAMSANLCFAEQFSNVNLKDSVSNDNREKWRPILDQFDTNLEAVAAEGDEVSLARHQERGQLLRKLPPKSFTRLAVSTHSSSHLFFLCAFFVIFKRRV
jgi:hypothetical protein